MYLPHYAVHTPLQAKAGMIEKFKDRVRPGRAHNNPTYAAMIKSTDESVGRIMKKLQDLKIDDHTVFIFTSDNGGLSYPKPTVTSNLPLREGKGSAYEGGVRAPLIVVCPGVVQPGSVCNEPAMSIDFYSTILDMANVKGDPNHVPDGVSLVPLLKQTGGLNRDALYWHYPHYHPGGAIPYGAIRKGDFKLLEFYEDNSIELYNLETDIGEKINLAESMPEKINELRTMLHNWRKSVGAQMPIPNPNYDPKKAHQMDRYWLKH